MAPVARALKDVFGTADHVPDGLELRSDHGPQYTGADCEDRCGDWHLDHGWVPLALVDSFRVEDDAIEDELRHRWPPPALEVSGARGSAGGATRMGRAAYR